jgi:hypothetical protein
MAARKPVKKSAPKAKAKAQRDPFSDGIYLLKVTLRGVKPAVWRHIVLPAAIPMSELHPIFQVAFGWKNVHQHMFVVGKQIFAVPDADDDVPVVDSRKTLLADVLKPGKSMVYTYDFGDLWEHDVTVEKRVEPMEIPYPLCVGGENAAPPEDCGGSKGYADLLKVLKQPRHKAFTAANAWVGGFWDPKGFDANLVNRIFRGQ